MKTNWFYILIAVLLTAMLFINNRFFKGSKYTSVGITHSREYKINAEKPATVDKINVVSGQQVKTGDLLVALTSSELEMQMAKLENVIEAMKSERVEKAKVADSRIAFVRAEQGVVIEKLNSDILQSESELRLNQNLIRQFAATADTAVNEHPVGVKLRALKQQRARQQEAIDIKVKDILQEKETEQRLLADKIGLLEREMQLLISEKRTLSKYASADGVVENIYVRKGEQVDAFTSLLSIHPLHPTTVVGYLVGKKEQPQVGSEVVVQSFENKDIVSNGKVIGYGAVVALPEILQKSTAVKAFGREVFIEIMPQNRFAAGEKVLIR
ncbi:MAG TPA: biotin/lipoyl-binding protein [Chryseosolibacter sp.]|nr:biotin/lipoyl-binding protein [Chryseosolibacter sp.]